jgi:hypothetical protein
MEMTSSTIIYLWSIFQRRDLSSGVLEDQSYLGMVLQIFLCRIDLGSFLMVAMGMFVLAIFVSTATSSTMAIHTHGSPTTSTRLFGCFFLVYWCWYSCWYWLTTSIVVCVHVVLALRLKIKLWEKLRWYFQVYDFVTIFGCLQKSTRLCHGRRKSLKTSKIC